jgi:hypothetical protein
MPGTFRGRAIPSGRPSGTPGICAVAPMRGAQEGGPPRFPFGAAGLPRVVRNARKS